MIKGFLYTSKDTQVKYEIKAYTRCISCTFLNNTFHFRLKSVKETFQTNRYYHDCYIVIKTTVSLYVTKRPHRRSLCGL